MLDLLYKRNTLIMTVADGSIFEKKNTEDCNLREKR